MKKKIAVALLLVASASCLGVGIHNYVKEKNAGKSYEELQEAVVLDKDTKEASTEESSEEVVAASSQEEVVPEEPAEPIPIDFVTLQTTAPDAYAWIRIPDTQIDYPIVQSPDDNAFYLEHNVQKNYEFAGAIYTENFNAKDFSDPVTILYGHNMKNGTMFQNLHLFQDKTFFDEHPDFVIYTPEKVLHYHVFAAINYDNRHLLTAFGGFQDKLTYKSYLESVMNTTNPADFVDSSVKVTTDDHIVVLSTCTGDKSTRFLLHAVLENP